METPARRRLTESEVRAILHAHTESGVKVPTLARKYGVHPNAVYNIIWGKTHQDITRGRNVSTAPARRVDIEARVKAVYAETGGNISETARRLGVSRPTVTYHLNKGRAA